MTKMFNGLKMVFFGILLILLFAAMVSCGESKGAAEPCPVTCWDEWRWDHVNWQWYLWTRCECVK